MWDVTYSTFKSSYLLYISTHTSRVGCDEEQDKIDKEAKISTHTSRVGCDLSNLSKNTGQIVFLLTHPVWDVTCSGHLVQHPVKFLLTHPVWDVTYPHLCCRPGEIFLLTHPVWDVTPDAPV